MKLVAFRGTGLALVCAVSLTHAPASAQTIREVEARHTPAFDRCLRSGDARIGVTNAILDCIGAETEVQDHRLNKTYRNLLRRLGQRQGAALRRAERVWIGDRETRCEQKAQAAEGGTLGSIIYSNCILTDTIRRTLWLERQPDH